MTKKFITIASLIIISILLGLNIYMYIRSTKVHQYVYENNSNAESIVLINKFRTDINRMAQTQKLYLLTSKEEYKNDYEKSLENIYLTINNLEQEGSLDSVEKQQILMSIDDYYIMNKDMMALNNDEVISEDMERSIIQLNQAQINILNQLDNSVDKTKESLVQKNSSVINQTDFQKNMMQVLSTVLTGLGSSILFYIKKNPDKLGNKVSKIIYCVEENQTKKEKE